MVIRIYIVEWTWIPVGIDVLAHSVVGQRHVVVSVTVGCPAAEVTTSVSSDLLAQICRTVVNDRSVETLVTMLIHQVADVGTSCLYLECLEELTTVKLCIILVLDAGNSLIAADRSGVVDELRSLIPAYCLTCLLVDNQIVIYEVLAWSVVEPALKDVWILEQRSATVLLKV